ncbi:MAG TPA: hypothetical protein VHL57_06155 [Flavobacteriales bacterium]|jgi:hypothetical protein|nr:hypothetical protein [Flavobacteriales bacterium]
MEHQFSVFAIGCCCAVLLSCGRTDAPLTGQWFGYGVVHCPDSIHSEVSDTMVLALTFELPDSGRYKGYFGTDLQFPMVRGKVHREHGSDALVFQEWEVPLTIIAHSADELQLALRNPENGCSADLVLHPFTGEHYPPLR